jgi:hypothetical protein
VLIDVVWHAAGSAGESVRAQDHRGKKRANVMGCQIAINFTKIVDISNAISMRITAEHECSAPIARGGSAQSPDPETFRFELAAIPIIQRSTYMQKEASNCPRVNRGSRRRAGTPRPVARARSSRHCSIRIGRNSFANSSIYACNTNCNCPQTILTTRQRARSNGV